MHYFLFFPFQLIDFNFFRIYDTQFVVNSQ